MKKDLLSNPEYPYAFSCIKDSCKRFFGCCPMWVEQTVTELLPDGEKGESYIKAGCIGVMGPVMMEQAVRLSGESSEQIAKMRQSVKHAAERSALASEKQARLLAGSSHVSHVPPAGGDILGLPDGGVASVDMTESSGKD